MAIHVTKTAGSRAKNPASEVAPEACYTTGPVQPGNFTGSVPEFGRTDDVAVHFGIKRGSLYGLLALGKVRASLLRVRGQKSGVRLWDMASIRQYINSEMQAEAA